MKQATATDTAATATEKKPVAVFSCIPIPMAQECNRNILIPQYVILLTYYGISLLIGYGINRLETYHNNILTGTWIPQTLAVLVRLHIMYYITAYIICNRKPKFIRQPNTYIKGQV